LQFYPEVCEKWKEREEIFKSFALKMYK